jgi:thiol:disulfide interchange protein DsbD
MRRLLITAVPLLLSLLAPGLAAQDSPFGAQGARSPLVRSSVLPADEAFALSTFIEAPDTVVLLWEIKDNYYLYRESLSVTAGDGTQIPLGELPVAEMITDEFFGDTDVYFGRLLHRIPLAAFPGDGNEVAFTLTYQGCAKDKYCYPMQIKEFVLTLPK